MNLGKPMLIRFMNLLGQVGGGGHDREAVLFPPLICGSLVTPQWTHGQISSQHCCSTQACAVELQALSRFSSLVCPLGHIVQLRLSPGPEGLHPG